MTSFVSGRSFTWVHFYVMQFFFQIQIWNFFYFQVNNLDFKLGRIQLSNTVKRKVVEWRAGLRIDIRINTYSTNFQMWQHYIPAFKLYNVERSFSKFFITFKCQCRGWDCGGKWLQIKNTHTHKIYTRVLFAQVE